MTEARASDPNERLSRTFPAGFVLFREGEGGREMFVVQSGKVRICKTVRQLEKTMVVLGPGEFFGEMSILLNQPRTATAIVEEQTRLLRIDPKVFEGMIRGNSEIALRLIKKLALRLQETNEQVENLLLRDHNSRVVHFLNLAAGRQGKASADGVELSISIREVASKIGLELAFVNEVFRRLVRSKLVRILAHGILLTDPAKLAEYFEFLEMKERFGDL